MEDRTLYTTITTTHYPAWPTLPKTTPTQITPKHHQNTCPYNTPPKYNSSLQQ